MSYGNGKPGRQDIPALFKNNSKLSPYTLLEEYVVNYIITLPKNMYFCQSLL